jgi:hypothetical protein
VEAVFEEIRIEAMAWQAMPSSLPMNPSFSVVVALMLILCEEIPKIEESSSFILLLYFKIFGFSQIIVRSIFKIEALDF